MRRAALLLSALAAAGCTAETEPRRAELPSVAAPRAIVLDWRETYGTGDEKVVFEVRRFVVRKESWEATVAIENRSSIPFTVGAAARNERTFGLMLFPTGDMADLEERARDNRLPPVRKAGRFEPEPPDRLPPGSSWRGTISARGSLPAGLWVRLVFGRLFAEAEELPPGLAADVSWITDHTFRL